MKFINALLVLIGAATIGSIAVGNAAELNLSGTADGSTRWFELFSDSFIQLDKAEPQLSNPTNLVHRFYPVIGGTATPQDLLDFDPSTFAPTNFNSLGSQVEAFTNDENFDLGALTYESSALVGVGVEIAPITGYAVDMAPNIGNSFAFNNRVYTTTIGDVNGTLTFDGGDLVGISLAAEITFALDFSDFGIGVLTYQGEFSISDSQFVLFVDQAYPLSGTAPMRYIWDSTGVIDETWADATGDGVIDGSDFLAWQRGVGKQEPAIGRADGDFNADGLVDAADLKVWKQHVGVTRELSSPSSISAAVPEPSAALLIGIAGVAACGVRRASSQRTSGGRD